VPESDEYESDDDLHKRYERTIQAPRMVEFERMEQYEEHAWSTISGSMARNRWNINTTGMNLVKQDEDLEENSSKNYYRVLREESESEEEESGENESEIQEEQTKESSFDPTVSEIDSRKYTEKESEGEDNEAFFERLADMTTMIDEESDSIGQQSDAPDGEASNESEGLRRSRRHIQAPCRLIEEIGVSVDEKGSDWKKFLVKVYENVLVGAGISGGFNQSSELNVIKYNKAMQSNNLEELTNWSKGMDK
jgi:hypothetical protein